MTEQERLQYLIQIISLFPRPDDTTLLRLRENAILEVAKILTV